MDGRVLILGGSAFVGRAMALEAMAMGFGVTTFNRGTTPPVPGVSVLHGDRHDPASLVQLSEQSWDLVIDASRCMARHRHG